MTSPPCSTTSRFLTKVAAKKTSGVLGDDLALNAQQVAGVAAERETPGGPVWAVAKGSAVNKLILIPAALTISALLSWTVIPLLMLGGGGPRKSNKFPTGLGPTHIQVKLSRPKLVCGFGFA